jgi:hypothetical protein
MIKEFLYEFLLLNKKFRLPKQFFKDFNEMVCMTELGFLKCANVASYHQIETLLRVLYCSKSVRQA